jgi:pyruvate ferredoxin oxidoreductase gamma subunit
MQKIYQIKFHSRGGQGIKTAARILAEAAIDQGKFAQAFSEFGPERAGAPMVSFLRISSQPIIIHSEVQNPDLIVIVDPTLIKLAKDKTTPLYIVNTSKNPEKIKLELKNKNCAVYSIDAAKIALDILGKNIPNIPLVGAIIALTDLVSTNSTSARIRKKFLKKIGKEMTEKNIKALKKGFDELKLKLKLKK